MIVAGAVLAATGVTAAILASRSRSVIGERLARLAPRRKTSRLVRSALVTADLAQSGLGWSEGDLVRAKIVAALAGAAFAAAAGLIVPIGPLIVAVAGYAGFILPTVRVDRAGQSQAGSCRDVALGVNELPLQQFPVPLPSQIRSPRIASNAGSD